MLNTQLPRMSPAAILGNPARTTELRPVANSGKDVTPAIRTMPSQSRLRPVFSAIMSPYRLNRLPE